MVQHKLNAGPTTTARTSATQPRLATQSQIAVIGMGYVGLMVATAFGSRYPVIGYDISKQRIESLKAGKDVNNEVSAEELLRSKINFTSTTDDLVKANIYIIAVPTPLIDKVPNLDILLAATELVAGYLKKGDIVIYESSVYPGATDEKCIPLLEKASGMVCGRDFGVGYSPERINPADKVHTMTTIPKIVSANDETTLTAMKELYGSIISAGVCPVSCIRAAEAAKIIENIQRDLNIGFVNEVAVILHHLNLDSVEVFKAMETKWNHLNFRPGLVGGHCIPFNSYYLVHQAQKNGYKPELILAARNLNEQMPNYIVESMVQELAQMGKSIKEAKIGIIGFSYKEDTPDVHDTQSILLVEELKKRGAQVVVCDPVADKKTAKQAYGVDLVDMDDVKDLDGAIITLAHKELKNMDSSKYINLFKERGILIDIKSVCHSVDFKDTNIKLWQL